MMFYTSASLFCAASLGFTILKQGLVTEPLGLTLSSDPACLSLPSASVRGGCYLTQVIPRYQASLEIREQCMVWGKKSQISFCLPLLLFPVFNCINWKQQSTEADEQSRHR